MREQLTSLTIATPNKRAEARFALVTAGHHFLLRTLPLGQADTESALHCFLHTCLSVYVSPPELDAVLLRVLSVLNRHTGERTPSLVDRYLAGRTLNADCLRRFAQCVEDISRYHTIRDGSVQDAVSVIHSRYLDPKCTPQWIAESLSVRLSSLDVVFKRETHCTLTEYIRDARLDHAALLLTTTNKTIKEIWASVGYGHHSNFDHDFKRRFQSTPREYRSRGIRPIARQLLALKQTVPSKAGQQRPSCAHVLLVDDNETSRACITQWLRSEGHVVTGTASGAEAILAVDTQHSDAVLLDYRLGDMDGIEVLRRIRQTKTGKAIGVSIFTADWDVYDRSDEVAALDGMVASKLCDLDQLSDLVVYLTARPDERLTTAQQRAPAWMRWLDFA